MPSCLAGHMCNRADLPVQLFVRLLGVDLLRYNKSVKIAVRSTTIID